LTGRRVFLGAGREKGTLSWFIRTSLFFHLQEAPYEKLNLHY